MSNMAGISESSQVAVEDLWNVAGETRELKFLFKFNFDAELNLKI